jgi:tetratricopeptide (TPR) repeat protein
LSCLLADNRVMRAIAIVLIGASLCHADWLRLESPGIELFTDAGEKSGRQLASRFEQVRGIFRQAGISDEPVRVRVFAFASQRDFHRYRADSDGFFQSGPDRDYIALYSGPDAGRVAFHEYVHLVLNHSAVPLPRWFDEGMAEFYSTAQVEHDQLRVGEPIASHIALLSQGQWLNAADLSGRAHGGLYYAESWALVHMLNLAPKWRDGMPQFALMLAQEKPAEEAFHEAFGSTLEDALKVLPAYLRSLRPATIPAALDALEEVRLHRLKAGEAAVALSGLALSVNQPALAKTLLDRMPESPEIEGARGAVALAENRREDARRHFDRAIAMGSRDAELYFEYASLDHDGEMGLLRKALDIDPEFADALYLLGVRATDDGNYAAAVEHLRAATRVRPSRSTYWHALGYAQAKAGQRTGAILSARRAVATAETDQEENMARALAGLPAEPSEPRVNRPAVTTPPSWEPKKGDARIEGTLTRFDCDSAPPRLQITDSTGFTITLVLQHPSEIELANAPQSSLQLSCGSQNMHVVVDYVRASGDVTRIEFRL